jgi:hypothetical protein
MAVTDILIFVEHLEEMALDIAEHKPANCSRYIEVSFMVWLHWPARLQQFLHHFNSLRPTMKCTAHVEANGTLPVLDILVMKKGPNLTPKVLGRNTPTGRYLNFKSNLRHQLKEKSFIASSVEPSSYVRTRQISAGNISD